MFGTVLAIFVLLGAGRGGVTSYVNSLGIPNVTYDSVAASYSGPTFDFGNTMFLMPFFFLFLFPWFNMTTIAGSELKGKSALRWSVPIAGFSVFILTLASFATMYYVGGFEFMNAALANPTLVFDYGFNFWTLAMGVANNVALAWVLGIIWIVWNLAVLTVTIMAFARYLLALAFDRFLPAKLAYVSPRFGSPVIAHLIDLIVAIALVGATAFYYGPLSTLAATGIAPMIFFVFVAISAILYGIRRETGSTRTLLVIAGILSALVFSYVSYEFFVLPNVYGGNVLSYSFIAVSFVAGLVIYQLSKRHLKEKGIDLSLVYKEIPPE